MPITFCFGNLLDCVETHDYIVHQTNSTSTRAAGIADAIFKRFPATNNYAPQNTNVVGRAEIMPISYINWSDRPIRPAVVNLCAQFHPGGPSADDDSGRRKSWFEDALRDMTYQITRRHAQNPNEARPNIVSPNEVRVAFPTKIGCGLAGGSWPDYLAILERWAAQHPFHVTFVESRTPKHVISSAAKGLESSALRIALSLHFKIGGYTSAFSSEDCAIDDSLGHTIRTKLTYMFPDTISNAFMHTSRENIDASNATLIIVPTTEQRWGDGTVKQIVSPISVGMKKCIAYATNEEWPHPLTQLPAPRINWPIATRYKPIFVVNSSSNINDVVTFLHSNAINVLNICASASPTITETDTAFLTRLLHYWIRSIALLS